MGRPKGSKNKPKEEIAKKEVTKEEIKKEATKKTISKKASSKSKNAPKGQFTCGECGQIFDTKDAILYKNKKYCQSCGKKYQVEIQAYNTFKYIVYDIIYERKIAFDFIPFQVKKIRSVFPDMSYKTMVSVLQYAIKYENIDISDVDPQWGIYRIILKYYNETLKFYKQRQNIEKHEKEFEKSIEDVKPRIVYLKRSEILERQKKNDLEKMEREHRTLLDEKDQAEILANLEENGTKETWGFN